MKHMFKYRLIDFLENEQSRVVLFETYERAAQHAKWHRFFHEINGKIVRISYHKHLRTFVIYEPHESNVIYIRRFVPTIHTR